MDLEESVRRLRAAGCVFAEDEADLIHAEFGDDVAREAAVERRVAGEPLEQILGWAEFAGLRIRVLPGAFVPRLRSTAILTALHGLIESGAFALPAGSEVVDMCCGTGALGAALVAQHPGVRVVAADIDPVAVACAHLNLPGERVVEGDLFDALPKDLRGRADLVVVNAPYVPTEEIAHMPPEARDHEHRVALDGGGDGLDLHRRIARDALAWVRPGGAVILETSRGQAPLTRSFFDPRHWSTSVVEDDEVDGTVVVAFRPPAG